MNLRKGKKGKTRDARDAERVVAPAVSEDQRAAGATASGPEVAMGEQGASAVTGADFRDDPEAADRVEVAEAVNRSAVERWEIAEATYRAAAERAEIAEALFTAAMARGEIAEARERAAAERAAALEAREEAAAERDVIANARDRAAVERDTIANTRDRAAVERDAIASLRPAAGLATTPDGASEDAEDPELDRARLEAELHRAHLDGLTGAYRREMGRLALRNEIDRARRADGKFVIAFIDVDGLKGVNDRSGHAAGDRVLRTLVATMRANLRSYDPIVRFGGDEFIAGISSIDTSEVQHRIDVIDQSLRSATGVGITAGLAELTSNESLDELTAKADAALIEAKRDRGE